MMKKITRGVCLTLCLLLLILALPSCQKSADPLVQSGISQITVDAKRERVTVTATLNAHMLEAHEGEKAFLYELLPGERVSALGDREPIAQSKVKASMVFPFALRDGAHTRLYSSFVIGFSDGTFLTEAERWIDNPAALAKDTRPFLWTVSAKGLTPTDADRAVEMGAMHAMFSLSFSELAEGDGTYEFDGATYLYSEQALLSLDRQIRSATNAGMQVSLTVIPDRILSSLHAAAYFDLLASRYNGGENGTLSAFFIDAPESVSADDATLLCRLANQALRSRYANARVYVTSHAATLMQAKTFFSDVALKLSAGGNMEWGAAIAPALTSAEEPMSPEDLSELSSFLFTMKKGVRISWMALCGLEFSAEDTDKQATSYAYAYRLASAAKIGLIFYGRDTDDATGLYAETGEARRIAEVFASIDSGLSEADRLLCETRFGEAWTALGKEKITRHEQNGSASIGTSGFAETLLFDFSDGESHGFVGASCAIEPTIQESVAFSLPVLYTWLEADAKTAPGVRKLMTNASSLSGAVTLSTVLLTQAPGAEECRVRLRLDGVATDGSLLRYEAATDVKNGSWQTVTFQVADFVADAELSAPCVLTLTVEPDVPATEDYVLWVREVNLRRPESNLSRTLPLLLIVLGAAVGFVGVLVLYRQSARKKRGARR